MRLFIKLQLALCLVFLTSCQSQPQQDGWKLRDLMIAGKMTVSAHSDEVVSSTSENQSIFGGAKRSMLVFACEDKNEHLAVFLFPRSLLKAIKDGKKDMTARMTIDDEVRKVNLWKDPNYPILFFKNTPSVMDDLVSASSAKVELSLPDGEQLSFYYELKDAVKMIEKVRINSCKAATKR